MSNTTIQVSEKSLKPKGGLPVYLAFSCTGFLGGWSTAKEAMAVEKCNLVIESSLNCHPRPFYRAFTTVAYPDGPAFWTETTPECGTRIALGVLMDKQFEKLSPSRENGWKANYSLVAAVKEVA